MAETFRVTLTPARIEVEPGAAPADATITLQNSGRIVEQYSVEVAGLDPEWFTAPVASIGLFPQDRDQLRLTFHPPKRPGVRAGAYPFHVIVRARGSGEEETVQGVLEVRGFAVYRVDLMPRRQTDRGRGNFRVQLTNTGTADVQLVLAARDAEEACRFRFPRDDGPLLLAGTKLELPLVVEPKKRPWVGVERTYEFTVTARPRESAGEPQEVAGQFTHRPLFRSWAPFRRAAVIILLIVLGLWLVDVLVATGIAGEFPRRVGVAAVRVRAVACGLPGLSRLCAEEKAPSPPPTPEPVACSFQFGFKAFADANPQLVGGCTTNVAYDGFGNGLQYTENGVLFWQRASNKVYFFTADRLYTAVGDQARLLDSPAES